MATARVLPTDSPELVRLHLVRLGLNGDSLPRAEAAAGLCLVLLTGAAPGTLAAIRSAGIQVVESDPDRARGAALLAGTRDALRRAARELSAAGPQGIAASQALLAALAGVEAAPADLTIGKRRFEWGTRTHLMGIVNVTPDSFSDGGLHFSADAAVEWGVRLAGEGADLLDIGGESTRPGSAAVSEEEELSRVVPVIERLVERVDVPISIDTTKARVAEAALQAGATLVNDISGFRFDEAMAPTIARFGAAACAMHIQGTPRTMQHQPTYFDVVGEVIEGLQASLDHAVRCGIPREKVLVDPGIGFGKTAGHNLFLLRNLSQLRTLGVPILVGASRKSFIGKLTALPPEARLPGSLAVLTQAILAGAHVLRVHDVAESRAAAQVADAIARAREGGFAFQEYAAV